MNEWKIPGMSIAIVHDQKTIFQSALGFKDLEQKQSTDSNTIYAIASVSKVFQSFLLMQLTEKGILRPDLPLNKILTKYPYKSTTLEQLASHTSGLSESSDFKWFMASFMGWIITRGLIPIRWFGDTSELLEDLPDVELGYKPDDEVHYSNLGCQLLGVAIEKAAGDSYKTMLQKNILQPIGMYNSGVDINNAPPKNVPKGYVHSFWGSKPLVLKKRIYGYAIHGGGQYSTVSDMTKFIMVNFQNNPRIISNKSLLKMYIPRSRPNPDSHDGYALGWGYTWIKGHYCLQKGGGEPGFNTSVMIIPDLKVGIVVMMNSWSPISNIYENGTGLIAGEILEELIPFFESPAAESATKKNNVNLNNYAGRYSLESVADFDVTVADNKLMLKCVQFPAYKEYLVPLDRYSFGFSNDKKATHRFKIDMQGKITSLTFGPFTFGKK
jgi:CubicO group peptidase (beta-lactamase class C family)